MTASQAYNKALIKSERNSTNDNVSLDKGRFVILYNEAQNRFTEYYYEKKNEDDFRYIQSLLVTGKSIPTSGTEQDANLFNLPKDYFDFSNVYGLASKGDCKNKKVTMFEQKDLNQNNFMTDNFMSPSFEYRQSPFILGGNKIKAFTDDFSIDSVILSYYRYPKQITLISPDNPESDFDDSQQLDFDDKVIDRIISATVGIYDINNSSDRWQLHNLQSKTEF